MGRDERLAGELEPTKFRGIPLVNVCSMKPKLFLSGAPFLARGTSFSMQGDSVSNGSQRPFENGRATFFSLGSTHMQGSGSLQMRKMAPQRRMVVFRHCVPKTRTTSPTARSA